LHTTALLETHALRSLLLPPTRIVPLWFGDPSTAPTTVTLTLPVDAALLRIKALTVGPS
jgi:hypothetical protein